MNELMELYNQALLRIHNDEVNGVLSEEQAAFARQDLVEELGQHQAEFSAQVEDEVAEFTAGNSLGATLIQLGEENGYEDPETFINDLSISLDISPEDVYNIITTEEDLGEEMAYAVLADLGVIEADDEEDEYDADELEDDEDEYEEEEFEDELEAPVQYSAYDPRVDELEAQIAEFQVAGALKDVLHKLDVQANELVNNGDMPPLAYNIMFGSFDSEEDRIAAFSACAESNGNTVSEEITAIEKTLDIFNQMGLGELGMFNALIEDEVSGNFNRQEEDPELEAEAQIIANRVRSSRTRG